MKEICPKTCIDASVRIPGSKSVIHRTLIAAALAEGESRLSGFLGCEDTVYTAEALRALGVRISVSGENVIVSGTGGTFPSGKGIKQLFLGNSGTTFRLLLSTVALTHGHYILTGESRMLERPIRELVYALKELGVDATCVGMDGFPPVFVRAKGVRGGKVEIKGETSSQYVSSLLLAAPCMDNGLEIGVNGNLVSRGYVDLTLDVMSRFGVSVLRDGYEHFKILPDQKYKARQCTIEGDVSSASYFWAAAAVTGGKVITDNIYPHETRQGDIGFLEILSEMGCKVEKKRDRVMVTGGPLSGLEADMSAMPDMVPTLAAISLFAHGKTTIRNVSHLRFKESDRLRGMAEELNRLGGRVKELPDGLIIQGNETLTGGVIDPRNDHRIAMSLAVVGLRVPGVRIDEDRCVKKSFPHFWDLWECL